MATELHAIIADDSAARDRTSSPSPPPVKILIVDDEPKNLSALEAVLAAEDRVLVKAVSGHEALRHVLRDDFAVVLLDVHMPGMDGFETAELIRGRQRSRETPIIFLTAAISGDVFIAKGYSLGAVDYLIKPIDSEMLRSKVNVFIELFRKTEQVKKQADALAETSAFLNSVLEGATGYAIMALDLGGGILSWNEGARRIYGYDGADVVGRANLRLLHSAAEGAESRVDALLEAARRDGQVVGQLNGVRKNGQSFAASISVEQRVTVDSRRIGYVAIAQDVTGIKEAERQRARLLHEQVARIEAERARDRLQQVLDVLPEGILLAEADGRISMCNAAAVAFFGQTPSADEPWGSTQERYLLDGTVCREEELPLARAVQKGEVVLGEQLLVKSAAVGDLVPVLMNSAPLRDPEGTIVGGVVAMQDISPIKELERQKDAFLAAASHDLKNPLAVVKGQAQLLMRRAGRMSSPEVAGMMGGLHSIDLATKRLAGMVNELLDVARLQMGRPIELDPRPMDVAALINEVAAELRPSTDRHEIRVETSISSLMCVWDRERIERLLVNLIANAIKYSPDGGPIVLALKEDTSEPGWVIVSVRDSGIGINADELPHVFERFFRGRNVGSIEGAGIGLAGVRQIAEQHEGTVEIQSAEGRGSTFIVRLPVAPAGLGR